MTTTLEEVLCEIDKVWAEIFHKAFLVKGDMLIRKSGGDFKTEMREGIKGIIIVHQSLLLDGLRTEIQTIRQYGSLDKVPQEMCSGESRSLRFSVAWHVILSQH